MLSFFPHKDSVVNILIQTPWRWQWPFHTVCTRSMDHDTLAFLSQSRFSGVENYWTIKCNWSLRVLLSTFERKSSRIQRIRHLTTDAKYRRAPRGGPISRGWHTWGVWQVRWGGDTLVGGGWHPGGWQSSRGTEFCTWAVKCGEATASFLPFFVAEEKCLGSPIGSCDVVISERLPLTNKSKANAPPQPPKWRKHLPNNFGIWSCKNPRSQTFFSHNSHLDKSVVSSFAH